MVVAGEVEQAVEDEDFDFRRERVALLDGLAERRGHTDGQVACNFFGGRTANWTLRGEGKHVSGLVLAPEAGIEFADGGIGGEQHGDIAIEPDGCLR